MICCMRRPSKGLKNTDKRLLVLEKRLKEKLYGGNDVKDNSRDK